MKEAIARRYTQLRSALPDGGRVTLLHIGAQQTAVASGVGLEPDATHVLALGATKTAADYFRHMPPTPAELENAILAVEDELMGVRALAGSASVLCTHDPALRAIALLAGVTDGAELTLSVEAVERLFDLLSAFVLGRPASSAGIPGDTTFAATLLILREFMHHLQFASIRVSTPQGPLGGLAGMDGGGVE